MDMRTKISNRISDIKDTLHYTFISGKKTGDAWYKTLNLLSGDRLRPTFGCMYSNIRRIEEYMDEECYPVIYDELGNKYINVSYVDLYLRQLKREIEYITGEES